MCHISTFQRMYTVNLFYNSLWLFFWFTELARLRVVYQSFILTFKPMFVKRYWTFTENHIKNIFIYIFLSYLSICIFSSHNYYLLQHYVIIFKQCVTWLPYLSPGSQLLLFLFQTLRYLMDGWFLFFHNISVYTFTGFDFPLLCTKMMKDDLIEYKKTT